MHKPFDFSWDATQIAKLLRERKLTSSETTQQFIAHIKSVNPVLNAMVETRFEEALAEAKQADQRLSSGQNIRPLEGVPMSIKESFDVKGIKTTGGLVHRHVLRANKDAEVIKRLKEAGAIILGKTNTPTLCFCQETDNKLYGRTNNPWNPARTAGGSSGGEGALLAVGGAAAGVGSDIGGSIRFPAHFNGVTGFKPGRYQVSDAGHFPPSEDPLQNRMLGMGPMGKSVRDMRLLYNVMTDSNLKDPDMTTLKVDIINADTTYPLNHVMRTVLRQLKTRLETAFSSDFNIPPFFAESAQTWQEIMSIDGGDSVKRTAFTQDTQTAFGTLVKERLTHSTDYHPYLTWALVGAGLFKPSPQRLLEIKKRIQQGDQVLNDYFDNRVLISPVYHSGAQEHGNIYKEIFSIRKTFTKYMPYTAYANVWGLPALVVPIGKDDDGMPVSVQLMSKNGNEEALFRVGEIIEREWGGFQRCTWHDQ